MSQRSLFDRAALAISPRWAARRAADRLAYDAVYSAAAGYSGGRSDRRPTFNWRPGGGSADANIMPTLESLRGRARDASRNAPIATAALGRNVTFVVGDGLRAQPQIDREVVGLDPTAAGKWELSAGRAWRLWAESDACDASRSLDFAGLQELVYRAALDSGDVFVVLRDVKRPGWPYGLALQVFEADQVSNPNGQRDGTELKSGNKIVGGVELDEYGAAVAYHFQNVHPGNVAGRADRTWSRVPTWSPELGRRQVLHLYDKLRPGQTRGVPFMAPVVEQLKQLTSYSEAELTAAVISAMIAIVHKGSGTPLPNVDPNNNLAPAGPAREYKMAPGVVLDLGKEDEVTSLNMGRPNPEFDPFYTAVVGQIAAAIDIPREVLLMHFVASYSASRAALEMMAQFVRRRRSWLTRRFCAPVYGALITEAIAANHLAAPGLFEDAMVRQAWLGCAWIGPKQMSLDPMKENKADEIAVAHGWKTDQEVTAEKTGGDWDRNIGRRKQEIALAADAEGMGHNGGPALDPEDNNDLPGPDLEDALQKLEDQQ